MISELILNLVWIVLGMAVWLCAARAGRRDWRHGWRHDWRQGIVVLLATMALFPCVSASDDRLSLKALGTQTTVVESNTLLPRTLERLETFQVEIAFILLLTIVAGSLLTVTRSLEVSPRQVALAGRSPPFAF